MGPGKEPQQCDNEELVNEFELACRAGDYEFTDEYKEEIIRRLEEVQHIDECFQEVRDGGILIQADLNKIKILRSVAEWHEDDGDVIWWRLPIEEPPYVGSPLDCDWIENYYTHWTYLVNPVVSDVDT